MLVLGDLVGYGADPNAVVERVRALRPVASVRGNHDKVAAGLDDAEDFNQMARAAARWTRDALTPSDARVPARAAGRTGHRRRLTSRSATARRSTKTCTSSQTSMRLVQLPWRRRPLCLFGHTHVALCAKMDSQRRFEIEMPQGHPEFETVLDAMPSIW